MSYYILPKKNNTIEFSIEDNGIGIDKINQSKLFDVFYQVNESHSKNGSGLGLAISKKLVELLGGTISVESEKNNGSIFTFTIKYSPYEEFQKKVDKNSHILKGHHILIIDQDIDNRLILGEMLFDVKMIPIICSSSKEALRMLSRQQYQFSRARSCRTGN